MRSILVLTLLAVASSNHVQHAPKTVDEQLKEMSDKIASLTDKLVKQSEIIETLEQKVVSLEDKRYVEQTPITYIAAVAAGFPISTSTYFNTGTYGFLGVINKQAPRVDSTNTGAQIYDSWIAGSNDRNQWFQVSFFTPKDIVAISTQGRPNSVWAGDQWVSSYKILYT